MHSQEQGGGGEDRVEDREEDRESQSSWCDERDIPGRQEGGGGGGWRGEEGREFGAELAGLLAGAIGSSSSIWSKMFLLGWGRGQGRGPGEGSPGVLSLAGKKKTACPSIDSSHWFMCRLKRSTTRGVGALHPAPRRPHKGNAGSFSVHVAGAVGISHLAYGYLCESLLLVIPSSQSLLFWFPFSSLSSQLFIL